AVDPQRHPLAGSFLAECAVKGEAGQGVEVELVLAPALGADGQQENVASGQGGLEGGGRAAAAELRLNHHPG
ncbi:hypothetical protein MYX04_15525, partial [Nitrospiraceae bacterium AH_259_D15_M11_P09]|nr:hypothetical protein [Nitrospiraceae bacterium AH_259_D15_M11_P09]